MTTVNENQIADIVSRVVMRLQSDNAEASASGRGKKAAVEHAPAPASGQASPVAPMGIFGSVNEAVAAANVAYETFSDVTIEDRRTIIEAMRAAARKEAYAQAQLAVTETGLGNLRDKLAKNLLAVDKTPGVEVLRPEAYTGDNGMALVETAPYGVIGSITPVTNPTATVVCNAIGMIAAGNSVVFNAHPSARECTNRIISALNRAIVDAGGPPNLLASISPPTIATAKEMMKHPGIRLLVVTGGPAVVAEAMRSGKKVIGAGPGNPPAVVDETANIPEAARHLVDGASFDNNIVCVLEKEIIVVESVADQLKAEMKKHGAYELNSMQIRKVEKLVIDRAPEGPGDHGQINKKWVGKGAAEILRAIGGEPKPDTRLLILDVPRDHPLVIMEQLMPVIPIVRVPNVDDGIKLARQVEHGFFHTAVMHSTNVDNLSKMARMCNTSIFVKNGPSIAGLGVGGEGFTSFTIASPTGEGLTCALTFTRQRRCTLKDRFRIV
ncbi:MAG: aldehyde dehydrogenase EutE [Nitrospinota bacterium]|nr:aldehyde dehydrogenase EutE [Nitrospinota bacterium]